MGWLSIGAARHDQGAPSGERERLNSTKSEDIGAEIPAFPLPLSEENLPFIDPELVKTHASVDSGGIWLVVDEVVYDVTTFLDKHPGGDDILEYFGGQNCSWQFWRFHSKQHLREYAHLRIGKTEGVENRWKEPENVMARARAWTRAW